MAFLIFFVLEEEIKYLILDCMYIYFSKRSLDVVQG